LLIRALFTFRETQAALAGTTPGERSDAGMAHSDRKTRRKRLRIRNKRLRHLKATKKKWKVS
jgi:hypothetical protein